MATCSNPKCGRSFAPSKGSTGRYCSRSCATAVNNTRPKRLRQRGVYACLACDAPVRHDRRYCNNSCQQTHQCRLLVNAWLSGEASGSGPTGELRDAIRRWLLDQAGHQCTRCGWNEPNPVSGKPILTVDHVDGDWTNNAPDNLVVLCFNCHTLTPTFGVLNRGNGTGRRRRPARASAAP